MERRPYIGLHAQTACIWEATARKPGNVHRYCDFDDANYLDFLIGRRRRRPRAGRIARTAAPSAGRCSRRCGRTRLVVAPTRNLGILLLLAPLTKAAGRWNLRGELPGVLDALTVEDAAAVLRRDPPRQPRRSGPGAGTGCGRRADAAAAAR